MEAQEADTDAHMSVCVCVFALTNTGILVSVS
jgi:hypothetical protein